MKKLRHGARRRLTVADPLSPACNRTIGDLAAGASVTYTCTLAHVQSAFVNVAVARGTAGATVVTATDSAPVKVQALKPPKRRVVKEVHLKKAKKHAAKHKVHKPKVVSHRRPRTTG